MKNILWIAILAAASLALLEPPAEAKSRGGILNPGQFRGQVKRAYADAQSNPAVASKVFCYCGCDKHAGHRSLKDCFASDHGTYCNTCRDEMIRAAQLARGGTPIAQIRQNIDSEYSNRYPFAKPSAILQAYRSSTGADIASKRSPRRTM
jgi:hypothetical protein